ncbi:MAG: biotin--[acetyl-CoA-carboxylase] ligase [Acidobacteriota bacterium]|nr:biotin--[acetyl-CoA-carboxylase] ligase [Acidobacteriota bacterium]
MSNRPTTLSHIGIQVEESFSCDFIMRIGEKIYHVESCSSTNDIARELILQGAEEGTVVISEAQEKGRGTKGRQWFSIPGKGIYLSVILRPKKSNVSILPLLAGVAVIDSILEATGIRVYLKWPNDIVWDGKKLGGILSESCFAGKRLHYVILGIGLNVSHLKKDFPEEIRDLATSLRLISRKSMKKDALLEKILHTLNLWYDIFLESHARKMIRAVENCSPFSSGDIIEVETSRGQETGVYQGIDSHGRLILEIQGEKRSFLATEILSPIQKKGE